MGWIAEYGSPIGYYAKLMEAGLGSSIQISFFDDIDYGYSRIQMSIGSTGTGMGLYKLCVIGLLAAVLLTVLALILYKLRPSESAGKAMAFKKDAGPDQSPAPCAGHNGSDDPAVEYLLQPVLGSYRLYPGTCPHELHDRDHLSFRFLEALFESCPDSSRGESLPFC